MYLGRKDGVYHFSYERDLRCKHEEWGVPLPNLPHTWIEFCIDGSLSPGHKASSFLRGSSDPVANIVSAADLHNDCPSSLLQALANDHSDREVWLNSFYEEKDSLESTNTYRKITLGEYRVLHEKGAPRAIPTMCVLTIKRDENLLPVRAKLRIVVFGNHEDRVWTMSEKFAPVLRANSLCYIVSLAVQKRRLLKQGDCKNAFCNGDLPDDEVTIVRPPSGDPSATKGEFWLLKKTLYGLCRSPRHWFDNIDKILKAMGLKSNSYDPCVYSGRICDLDDPAQPDLAQPLTLGLYLCG